MDWLREAVHGFEPPKSDDDEVIMPTDDMPHIDQPNVRWVKRKSRPPSLFCAYWDGAKWKRQSVTPKLNGNAEHDIEVSRMVASDVQDFYDKHHVEDASNEGS